MGITSGNFTGSIHGSYSKRHQETKKSFFSQKSSMLHTKLRHHAYTLIADTTGGLHPGLERRLTDVAESLDNGLTLRARFQMEMIVRDYGTHVAYKVGSANLHMRLASAEAVAIVFTKLLDVFP